jgi:hypothetical protein
MLSALLRFVTSRCAYWKLIAKDEMVRLRLPSKLKAKDEARANMRVEQEPQLARAGRTGPERPGRGDRRTRFG